MTKQTNSHKLRYSQHRQRHEGVTLVAVPSTWACKGCFLYRNVKATCYGEDGEKFNCTILRRDGQNIIWVKAEEVA